MLIANEIVYKVAGTITAALAIEASIPKKPTTVSYRDKLKDLELSKFILSSTVLTPIYSELIFDALRGKRSYLSRYILNAVKSIITSRLISTNTSFGFIILTIPLTYSVGLTLGSLNKVKINRETDIAYTIIDFYRNLTKDMLMKEELTYLCRAFKVVSPSYLSKVLGNIPDIEKCDQVSRYTIGDLLNSSRYLDIIMYELYHDYPLTIMTYEMLKGLNSINDTALLKVFMSLSTKLNDSIILKQRGYSYAILTKFSMKFFSNGLISPQYLNWFRRKGINLGSISDVLACALSLHMSCKEIYYFITTN